MNKDNISANRRRNIVTPAMRKAEEEKKLQAQKQAAAMARSTAQKPSHVPQTQQRPVSTAVNRTASAPGHGSPRAPQRTSVDTRAVNQNQKTTTINKSTARPTGVPSKGASSRMNSEQQQQMLVRQRQIEALERQLKEENERRAAEAAHYRKIRDLEYRIDQQKLIRNRLIAKDMNKNSPESAKIRSVLAVAVIAVLIIFNIIAFAGITKKDVPSKNSSPNTETLQNNTDQQNGAAADTNNSNTAPQSIIPSRDKFTVTSADYVNGTLVLVNSEHPYNFDNTGTDICDDDLVTVATNIKDKAYKASNYKILLNRETVEMMNLMMADFYAYCQKDDVMVNTAYRTFEQQQDIYDSKKKQLGDDQKIAQTPGSSEHHTGYAFDLAIYPANENGSTFIKVGDYTWIYENCHKYGFVLRYPEGKTAITGIDPESWHFRYVGIPHATYMYNKGKTLEEYMTDISIYSESIPLTITVSDNETYSVFYVKKGEDGKTTFSVPKDTEYKISGNNIDGFIVWYNNADIGNRGKIQPAKNTMSVTPDSGEDDSNAVPSGTAD